MKKKAKEKRTSPRRWGALWDGYVGSHAALAHACDLSRQGLYDLMNGMHRNVPTSVLHRVIEAWRGSRSTHYMGDVPAIAEFVAAWKRKFGRVAKQRRTQR